MSNGSVNSILYAGGIVGVANVTSALDNASIGTNVTINTSNAPFASFTANPTSGTAPVTVSFTDHSTGTITSYSWNFGDSIGTSTQQNPTYTYNNPGTYTVKETVTGPGGSNSTTLVITVYDSTLVTIYRNGVLIASYVTINDAINAALAGDTITLQNGATFNENNLTISKNLIINVAGNGTATVNGGNTQTIFTINTGITAILQNLIITNGKGSNGGGVNNKGNLTLTNCNLKNNLATSNGGAIYNTGNLTLNNDSFTGNTATYGGALCNNGNTTDTNSTYTGNSVNGNGSVGGAVCNGGTITVTSCTYSNNTVNGSGGMGGAIENEGTANISNSNFTGNNAFAGGAIRSNNQLNTNNDTFTSNTATYGGALCNDGTTTDNGSTYTGNTGASGGAIYNDNNLSSNNSTYTSLDTGTSGGAIYNEGPLNTGNNNYISNTASYMGGAIYNDNGITDNNSTYTGNSANYGGAVCNDGTVTTTNSTYTGNTATNNGVGGAICTSHSLTLTNSTLTNNTAYHGGAVYNENSGTSTIQYNRITGNTAPDIYNNNGSMNANYNWWGNNYTGTNPTSAGRINVGTSSIWIVLTLTANPTTTTTGGTSTITADLLHDNQGTYHNPANGLVPYTGLVTCTTSLGTINNTYMCNGLATTTLNAGNNPGTATITSKIDNTTTNTVVTINASPAPIASFTENTTSGAAPLKVNFTDTSTGTITSYNWNFGDGTGTSTVKIHLILIITLETTLSP